MCAECSKFAAWLSGLFKNAFVLLLSAQQLVYAILKLLVLYLLFLVYFFVVDYLFQEKVTIVFLTKELNS
jgi:hypothetical protein